MNSPPDSTQPGQPETNCLNGEHDMVFDSYGEDGFIHTSCANCPYAESSSVGPA